MARNNMSWGLSSGTIIGLLIFYWIAAPYCGLPNDPGDVLMMMAPERDRGSEDEGSTGLVRREPPVVTFVANVITFNESILPIVRRLGEPTCSGVSEGQRMAVYSRVKREGTECEPAVDDLVLYLDNASRIQKVVPVWGGSEPITDMQTWIQARDLYQRRRR